MTRTENLVERIILSDRTAVWPEGAIYSRMPDEWRARIKHPKKAIRRALTSLEKWDKIENVHPWAKESRLYRAPEGR